MSRAARLIRPKRIAVESERNACDRTLNQMSANDRRVWGDLVRQQLESVAGSRFVALAGVRYCEPLVALDLERPMAGLGIGQQLAWLSHARKATTF